MGIQCHKIDFELNEHKEIYTPYFKVITFIISLNCASESDPWPHLYSSDMGMETGARLVSFTRMKKAWAGWSWRRRRMILMSSPTVTWSGIRNLVLSSTGSCFSPPNLSMMQGTLLGCSARICSTSFTRSAAINTS